MCDVKPFVKWAGGKSQLLARLRQYAPISFSSYYEPFIGGGAFFLDVHPQNAVINDINAQLLNAYRQLRDNSSLVISCMERLDAKHCNKDVYLARREEYNNKIRNQVFDAECAALMIWLNKHCFNGLYRVNSKGLFNVPYNNKTSGASFDKKNLLEIGSYLSDNNVQIRQGDFENACQDVKAGDFVYFDSPYVPVSETANFTSYAKEGFGYEEHVRLSKLFRRLDRLGAYVMLSNHDVPLVVQLYEGFNIHEVAVKRNVNCDASKRSGEEVIITNYDLQTA